MSTATETCACGASITVTVRDGLVLGFRLAEWRKEHQHDDEVTRLRNWKAEALAVLAEWDGVYEALGSPATLGERKSTASFREVMRLREEAATGPSWNAVALRSALVAMTVERDDLRAAHERLDRDARAVAGRSLHYEARAEKAEAACARVRALTEDEWGPLSDDVERCALCRRKWSKHGDDDADHPAVSSALVAYVIDLRAALDGGDDDD